MNKGSCYEARAADILAAAGLRILERNFRCRLGEIDLVCRDGAVMVFVEVRYRSHSGFASAAASVDRAKQRRLSQTAQYYLQQRGLTDRQPCRIDVLAFDDSGSPGEDEIQWLQNAVTL